MACGLLPSLNIAPLLVLAHAISGPMTRRAKPGRGGGLTE